MTGQRLFVVGASGFLGRALVREATARGVQTVPVSRALDLAPEPGSLVVNVAGLLTGDPADLRSANTDLPARLGRLCLAAGASLLHVGSAAEYGSPLGDLAHEDDPEQPLSPYGETKLGGTQAVRALVAEGLTATVARVFNVVGGYDRRADPISQFAATLHAVEDGGTVHVRDASLERDLEGIDWVAGRLLDLDDHVGAESVVNACTGRATTFGAAVTAMAASLGRQVTVEDGQEGGLPRVVGDPHRLVSLLGPSATPEAPEVVAKVALMTEEQLTSARRG